MCSAEMVWVRRIPLGTSPGQAQKQEEAAGLKSAEPTLFWTLIHGVVARIGRHRLLACALVERGSIAVRREWRLGALTIFPRATKEIGVASRGV